MLFLGTYSGVLFVFKTFLDFFFFLSKHQNESHQHVCSPLFGFALSDDSTESGWDLRDLHTYF